MVVGYYDGEAKIEAGKIALSINTSTGESEALINANHIALEGQTTVDQLLTGLAQISSLDVNNLKALTCDFDNVTAESVTTKLLTVNSETATWQTYTARYCTLNGTRRYFMYTNTSGGTDPVGTVYGQIVASFENKTIQYLGKAPATPT
jgi:hypothetical protein